jgi:hypothetical protein
VILITLSFSQGSETETGSVARLEVALELRRILKCSCRADCGIDNFSYPRRNAMALIWKLSKESSIQTPSDDALQTASGEPPRKRPASERQIQANRENSRRSTGPKTERGKRMSSRNAITHGFLARVGVIRAEYGEESLEEFQAFLERLYESYEPVGVNEELLVQTIANCWLRKARLLRAENGEICKQLDLFANDQAQRALAAAKQSISELETSFSTELFNVRPAVEIVSLRDSAKSDLRKHSIGRSYLARLLQEAKFEIIDDGHLSNMTAAKLFLLFNLWDHSFARACLQSAPSSEGEAEIAASIDNLDDGCTDEGIPLLKSIHAQIEIVESSEKHAKERETLTEARRLSLPPADVIDKHIRYGTQADRELYRAMGELERLQRQRKGENVPPPLNVKLE